MDSVNLFVTQVYYPQKGQINIYRSMHSQFNCAQCNSILNPFRHSQLHYACTYNKMKHLSILTRFKTKVGKHDYFEFISDFQLCDKNEVIISGCFPAWCFQKHTVDKLCCGKLGPNMLKSRQRHKYFPAFKVTSSK